MNLADAIESLIVAVNANTEAVKALSLPRPVPAKAPAAAPAPAPVLDFTKVAKPAAPAALTYEADVRPVAIKVAGKLGRDALVALFAEFGVKAGPELPADKFAPFIARANEVLA
jgi:hypothetical protein